MKRRMFGVLAGASLATLKSRKANAQVTADASLLTTTLNPLGGERAGNADGSIPAWTGGYTTMPAGLGPNDYVPELFPDEKPILVIDASNMAQHADKLSEGVMAMMSKNGYSIQVFPTHRTGGCAPQYVIDNTAKNVTRASFPQGPRFGLEGAYGGIPFPIPTISDPELAGAQIVSNYECRWGGFAWTYPYSTWDVSDGQLSDGGQALIYWQWDYYNPNGSPETFDGTLQIQFLAYTSPSNLVGQELIVKEYLNEYKNPQDAWQLLNGQGRVRRAPEIAFDTPGSQSDGIANYDEYSGFNGSLERYDWKYIEKKEMYVPYNNNRMFAAAPQEAHGPHFIDPNLVRWELHRCWVVEATLHPGERNVIARRKFYFDEDTWIQCLGDMFDANNNLYKLELVYNYVRPNLPGTVYQMVSVYNLQTGNYTSVCGAWGQSGRGGYTWYDHPFPSSTFDPQDMAASAQY